MRSFWKPFSIAFLFSGLFATASAQKIKGTHCEIQVPKGFTPAQKFIGYEHKKSGASIMVSELPAPFLEVTEGFNEEGLSSKGILLRAKEMISINGQESILLMAEQESGSTNYLKIILASGDEKNTVIVTGNLPESAASLENAMMESIKTLSCNFSEKLDPAQEAPFRINTSGTTFQPVHFMSGTLLFTADGKLPSDEALFTAGESFSEVSGTVYGKAFTENRFMQLAKGRISKPSATRPVQVGNLKGHEIIGSYDDKGHGMLFLTILNAPARKGYFIFVGETHKNGSTYLPQFRQMTTGFKLK